MLALSVYVEICLKKGAVDLGDRTYRGATSVARAGRNASQVYMTVEMFRILRTCLNLRCKTDIGRVFFDTLYPCERCAFSFAGKQATGSSWMTAGKEGKIEKAFYPMFELQS